MTTPSEQDYVLGTHDEEVARLKLQHDLWRPRVLDLWKDAGLTRGHTVLDLGCGPGFASLDLAEIVGPSGRVVAVDRSERFVAVLREAARARGLAHVEPHVLDLNASHELPGGAVDAVWDRWCVAFVERPRELVAAAARLVRPGGVMVVHEYLAYELWHLLPRSTEFEAFVRGVIRAWREAGGEPNIAGSLLSWLQEPGFSIEVARPVVDVLSVADPLWQWPRAFVETGLDRLVQLGTLSPEAARATWKTFLAREADPATRMVTPPVLQIVARKARA